MDLNFILLIVKSQNWTSGFRSTKMYPENKLEKGNMHAIPNRSKYFPKIYTKTHNVCLGIV